MNVRWTTSPEDVFPAGFRQLHRSLLTRLQALAERRAAEIEAWMKTNARWKDDTGEARARLTVEIRVIAQTVMYRFISGSDHGLDLETMNQGEYSIIGPAMDYWGPIILQDIKELLRA